MGYAPILDRRSAKESWVRLLGRGHYPRFHIYLKQYERKTIFTLHLDQKQSTIPLKGIRRHGGEYDSSVVAAEVERIKRWLQYADKIK